MAKVIGHGTLVKVDHDSNGSFTTVGCVRSLTPPPRSKEPIESTCMEDTIADYELAIEDGGDFVFQHATHPNDSTHVILQTLLTNGTEVNWQVYYGSYTTPITAQFAGKVISIAPENIDSKTLIADSVTVRRTGAISYS